MIQVTRKNVTSKLLLQTNHHFLNRIERKNNSIDDKYPQWKKFQTVDYDKYLVNIEKTKVSPTSCGNNYLMSIFHGDSMCNLENSKQTMLKECNLKSAIKIIGLLIFFHWTDDEVELSKCATTNLHLRCKNYFFIKNHKKSCEHDMNLNLSFMSVFNFEIFCIYTWIIICSYYTSCILLRSSCSCLCYHKCKKRLKETTHMFLRTTVMWMKILVCSFIER